MTQGSFKWLSDDDNRAEGTHNCHHNAKCTNTVGIFNCSCNDGYTGNGVVCTGNLRCGIRFVIQFDKLSTNTIADNYILVLVIIHADINECKLSTCQRNARCTHSSSGFTSFCNYVYKGNGTISTGDSRYNV